MNLLHVISSINPKGGGPIEVIKQFQSQMYSLNVHVEIVCCDAPDAPWLDKASVTTTIHALGPAHLTYGYTPRLLPWLRENAHRFDAVIINGIWQYHSLAVRLALFGSKTPYFVFTHGMLAPWFKRAYPLKHFKKWLYWPLTDYRVLRDARAVIFTTEEERIMARKSFWLYKANEVVASLGTSTPPNDNEQLANQFLTKHPELQGKRIVLFMSRFHVIKGCDLLLDAFASAFKLDNRLHLIMAGPDQHNLTSNLQQQSVNLGISTHISWTGMLKDDDKWGALYAAEVFCLPSHHENFGVVVAEALACGKPVLISNKVNIWREIEEDKAGFVDTDTVEGTVRNFKRWLALDSTSYAEMGQRARKCFSQRFHISSAAARLIEIISNSITK